MTEPEPSPNGAETDRDAKGRFLPGNPGGPGNPHARLANDWHKAVVEVVTYEKMVEVIKTLLANAIGGKLWAMEELFRRCGWRVQSASDEEGGKPAYFQLNVDLGNLMRERMVSLSGQAPAPGLRALPACQGESDEQEAGEEDDDSPAAI